MPEHDADLECSVDRGDAAPPRLLVLTGPTATGKTAVSLALAEAVAARYGTDIEVLSADSRQVYRALTIGTAKPEASVLRDVRHHFINELELDAPFSAGRFADAAESRIADVLERGVPLIVGGSTLYVEALVHGLASIPRTSEETRAHLTQRLGREGPESLYRELKAVDPEAAATMDATKTQRLVRALEVYHDTGAPLSHWQQQTRPPAYGYDVVVLTRPRAELYARIEARVDAMLDAGLLDENRALFEAGADPDLPSLQTIGYREPIAHLRGAYDYAEMVRLLKRNSRRYAKRQLTWFRRHASYRWIDVSARSPEEIADELLPTLESGLRLR